MKSPGKIWLAALGLMLASPLPGDEGLWLFNNPPDRVLRIKYGFTATPEWLSHLQLSSVRFGGASGSFVSPSGLIITNHHVGRGIIQNLSTKDRDLLKIGFQAATTAEELKCPGLEVSVLQRIEDVTARIRAADRPGMTPAEAAAAREAAIAALEAAASMGSGVRGSVVNLYSGEMYHLYTYKLYDDLRLVFAPEFMIAKFGGDPDNFCFPRFALDICFFRAYENGRPASTPHYLKWTTRPLKEGDLVFVSGHPGSTGRLLTSAQLEFLRDVSYPFMIRDYQRRRALLQAYGRRGSEEARVALAPLMGIENSLKAVTGYQSGLLDPDLMARKASEEKTTRDAVRKNPELQQECGAAWDEIAAAERTYASLFIPYQCLERGLGFDSVYFGFARTIARWSRETSKPNPERLKEFRDADLPSTRRNLLSAAPIDDELEIAKLAGSLAELAKYSGKLAVVDSILGGGSPEEVAAELVRGTTIKDPEARKRYLDRGIEAVKTSDDPMIKLALLVDAASREARSRYEREVAAVETRGGALVARALFRLLGTSVPPDATSTLRLSFGQVRGYVEAGKPVPFSTTFAGLFERSKQFGHEHPFELPASFKARGSGLRPDTPLNFVATCDSIGGNSGSPVVNREGEFVGILFDGNIQSLPARFLYTDELNRSVMVHQEGIFEALAGIYEAEALLREIRGAK